MHKKTNKVNKTSDNNKKQVDLVVREVAAAIDHGQVAVVLVHVAPRGGTPGGEDGLWGKNEDKRSKNTNKTNTKQ